MARPRKTKAEDEQTTTRKRKVVRVGDVVVLQQDHHSYCFDLHAGDTVLITGEGKRGYSINSNPENPKAGFEMCDCGFEL